MRFIPLAAMSVFGSVFISTFLHSEMHNFIDSLDLSLSVSIQFTVLTVVLKFHLGFAPKAASSLILWVVLDLVFLMTAMTQSRHFHQPPVSPSSLIVFYNLSLFLNSAFSFGIARTGSASEKIMLREAFHTWSNSNTIQYNASDESRWKHGGR